MAQGWLVGGGEARHGCGWRWLGGSPDVGTGQRQRRECHGEGVPNIGASRGQPGGIPDIEAGRGRLAAGEALMWVLAGTPGQLTRSGSRGRPREALWAFSGWSLDPGQELGKRP